MPAARSTPSSKHWSQHVTDTSDALDLKDDVFKLTDPKKIAQSLKRSAEHSDRRKSDPYRSAMSMLTFYINRAGHNLGRRAAPAPGGREGRVARALRQGAGRRAASIDAHATCRRSSTRKEDAPCRSLFQRRADAGRAAQVEAARAAAMPLGDGDDEFDDLLRRIGNARFVLLGEASHGTHEFYAARARITMRLVAERGFSAVAIEGDWPDAYRVNRYVRGLGDDARRRPTRCRASAASRPGCGATPRWSTSSSACATGTAAARARRAPASTASTSTASTLDGRGARTTSTARIPALARPRPRALRLLRAVRRRQPGLRPDDRPRLDAVLRGGRDPHAARPAAAPRTRARPTRTIPRPGSTPSRTRRWCATPSATTAACT